MTETALRATLTSTAERMRHQIALLSGAFEQAGEAAGRAAEQVRRVYATVSVPVPLRTGKRGWRTRAEHARILREARWKRRRERRHGIPACQRKQEFYLPAGRIIRVE